MRRLSYVIPSALVGFIALQANPSWWAVAMLTGGVLFVWDWLWGDIRVLNGAYGLRLTLAGLACVTVALVLAWNLGLDLSQFHSIRGQVKGQARLLYNLPAAGIGIAVYGLLVWSRAFARSQERD